MSFTNSKIANLTKNSKIAYYLLIVILLISLFLRLYNASSQTLYIDESWSAYVAKQGLVKSFFLTVNYEEHPPLFNMLASFWVIFGHSHLYLRLLPILFGVLSVLFIFLIGNKLFNSRVGLISALILSLSVEHIRMSQEFRPYSLAIFLCIVSFYFLIKSLSDNKNKNWVFYSIFIILLGYTTHFSALYIIAIFFTLTFLYIKNCAVIKKFLTTHLIIFIFLVPNILIAFHQLGYIDYISKNGPALSPLWKWLIVPYNFVVYLFGSYNLYLHQFTLQTKFLVPFILSGIFLMYLFFRGITFVKDKKKQIILLLILLFPVISIYLVSFIKYIPLEPKRFLFITFPLYLFIAVGIDSFNNRKYYFTSILLVLLIGLTTIIPFYTYQKEDWRSVINYIMKNEKNGDIIGVLPSFGIFELKYYYKGNLSIISIPENFIKQGTEQSFYRPSSLGEINQTNFINSLLPLKTHKRFWFIKSRSKSYDPEEYLFSYLNDNYKLLDHKKSSEGSVDLYLYELQ